jgi:hypothetical protein
MDATQKHPPLHGVCPIDIGTNPLLGGPFRLLSASKRHPAWGGGPIIFFGVIRTRTTRWQGMSDDARETTVGASLRELRIAVDGHAHSCGVRVRSIA